MIHFKHFCLFSTRSHRHFKNIFIDIEFIYRTIPSFKIYSSVVFIIVTELCSQSPLSNFGDFHHPQKTLYKNQWYLQIFKSVYLVEDVKQRNQLQSVIQILLQNFRNLDFMSHKQLSFPVCILLHILQPSLLSLHPKYLYEKKKAKQK